MPRIIGVDIPKKKRLIVSLTYLKGIGPYSANQICEKLGLDPDTLAEKLDTAQVAQIGELLTKGDYVLEGELRRQTQNAIKRLQSIRCYRGDRHRKGLPVRGQRTQTNARTRKGPKKTVAGKKKAV